MFGLKTLALPTKTKKITLVPPHFKMLEAHSILLRRILHRFHALGACFCASGPNFSDLRRF